MVENTIAIIGMGPRGLSILERLIMLYKTYPYSGDMDVLLIDPNELGTGVHSIQQPDHLLVNTIACQITLFGDDTIKDAGPIRRGPNFYQWATQQGYRRVNGAFIKTIESDGEEIKENDYLPRSLLGMYLEWGYQEFIRTLPQGMNVRVFRQRVDDLFIREDRKVDILLSGGEYYSADFIYITTGHGKNIPSQDDCRLQEFVTANQEKNPLLQYYATSYPVSMLDSIPSEARVLIQGIGLTAYDVLSQLTHGRGGIFNEKDSRLQYIPSGLEPKISVFSRQTLPFNSRAINQKGISGQYKPSFFTPDKLKQLQIQNSLTTGSQQLNFKEQVLPLLIKEMGYVYHCTLNKYWQAPDSYHLNPEDTRVIEALLYPHHGKDISSLHEYTQFFMDYLKDDLLAAQAGNIEGPIKAATDVLRDTRDILRLIVDFRGLSADSHKDFIEYFTPVFNRISVGPPMQRNLELQALMETGIVTLAGGVSSTLKLNSQTGCFEVHTDFTMEKHLTEADVLIKAKLDKFSPLKDESLLIQNLSARGIFRPFMNQNYHPGGIDIDHQQHPVNTKGKALSMIWVLGNVAEGPNFYTYVLPRPLVNSRFIRDAGRCVIEMYQQIQNCSKVKKISIYN